MRASGATVMQATPSMWKILLETGWERDDKFKILCGGEALSRPLADRLLDARQIRFGISTAPRRSTIWSAMHKVERR